MHKYNMSDDQLPLRLFFQHYYSLEWLRKYIFMKRIELQTEEFFDDSEPITKRFYHLWFLIRLAHDDCRLIADILPLLADILDADEKGSYEWLFFYADIRKKISLLSEGDNPKMRKLWENILKVLRNAEIQEIKFIIDENLPLFLEAKAFESSYKYEDIGQLSRDDQISILTQWADLQILQRKRLEWKRSEEDLEQYISMAISPIVLSFQEIHGNKFSKEDYDALTWLSLKSNEFAFFPRNLNPITLPAVSGKSKLPDIVQFVIDLESFQASVSSLTREIRSIEELQNIKNIINFLDRFGVIFEEALLDISNNVDLNNFDSMVSELESLTGGLDNLVNAMKYGEDDLSQIINHMKIIRETYAQSKEFDRLLQKKFTAYQENIITCYSHVLEDFSHGRFPENMANLPQLLPLESYPVFFKSCKNFKFLEDYYKLSIQPDSLYSPIYSRVLNMSIDILDNVSAENIYNPFGNVFNYNFLQKFLLSSLSGTQSELKFQITSKVVDIIEQLMKPKYCKFKFDAEIRTLIHELFHFSQKNIKNQELAFSLLCTTQELLTITNKLHFQLHLLRVFLIMSDSNGDKQTIEKAVDLFPQSPFKAYFTLLQRITYEIHKSCDLTALESMIHEDRVLDPTLLQEICEMCQSLFEEEFCDPRNLWKYGIQLYYCFKDKAAILDSFVFLLHCFLAVVRNERYLFDQWKSLYSWNQYKVSFTNRLLDPSITAERDKNIKVLVGIERFTILRQRSPADIALILKNMITDKDESFESKTRRKGMIIFEKALSFSEMHTPHFLEVEINGLLDLCLLYFNLIESKRPTQKNKKNKSMSKKGPPSALIEDKASKSIEIESKGSESTIEAQINPILTNNPSFQSLLNPQPVSGKKKKKSGK